MLSGSDPSAILGLGNKFGKAAALGGIGAGLGQLFSGYKNPADSASGYFSQIPDILKQYLSPYINTGTSALNTTNSQFSNLINDPNSIYKKLGAGYQQSPGYQFSLNQGLTGINNAAAAGGMLGTPQHQQQSGQLATNLANQDFNNYMNANMGLFNTGLSGMGHISDMGYNASNEMSQDLINSLLSQANLSYAGQANENSSNGGAWGSLASGAAAILPFLMM